MSRSLKGVLCEECRSKGHACQAQIWIEQKPLCLRCADGEPCCFETAKSVDLAEWRSESQDVFTMPIRQIVCMPRPVKVQPPKFEASELRQLRSELELTSPEKVALRHGLEVAMVEEFKAQDEARKQARESKEESGEREPVTKSIAAVQTMVAAHFGMTRAELKTVSRARKVVTPRQIAMYLAARVVGNSLTVIGQAFGGMHHTTVYHSVQVIERGIKADNGLKTTVWLLRNQMGGAALQG